MSPGPVYLPDFKKTSKKSNASAVISQRYPVNIANGVPASLEYDRRRSLGESMG